MKRTKPSGKWIEGLTPDMPALEAAHRVLDIRLRAVEFMLPLADRRATEDVEHIHQLRVATRRADAAARQFESCIRARRYRTLRRRLRRIRRAAGVARECDVHGAILAKLRDRAEGPRRDVLEAMVAWTAEQRAQAQRDVHDVAKRYPVRMLSRKRTRLIETLRHPSGLGRRASFRTLALATLPPLADALMAAKAADLSVVENLHALRLEGKRLRYAAEVFAPCFGDDFRQLYASVSTLQEHLGDINDSFEMIARVEAFAADRTRAAGDLNGSSARATDELRASFRDRLERQIANFLAELRAGAWANLAELPAAVRGAPPDEDQPDPLVRRSGEHEVQI